MLHTLRHSPWHTDITALCRLLKVGDDLLLIEDGVLAMVEGNPFLEILRSAPITLYVLREDVEARGLAGQIPDDIASVDYTDFVRLAVKHPGQLAW